MTRQFVKTDTILDKIMSRKVEELTERKSVHTFNTVRELAENAEQARDFYSALKRDDNNVALIAEVKKASPSKGVLIEDFDPTEIGKTYGQNGASAISVLTDEDFFQGHLDYLRDVRSIVDIPVLRKDFIVDPYQIYEGRAASADAILLIVSTLEDSQMSDLYALIRELNMTALVEVHNETEMERALTLNARLIGVNNRDLKTFDVDLSTTARLAEMVTDDVVLVAESGIRNAQDVHHMGQLGAHAVLVGESMVKAGDIAQQVREFSSQSRDK